MSGKCYKCSIAVIFKEPVKKSVDVFGYPCDHCKKVVCQTCSELSPTELRAVLLSKRTMAFFCPDCSSSVKKLLHLVDRVSSMENDIGSLKDDIAKIPEINNKLTDLSSKLETFENKLNNITQNTNPDITPSVSSQSVIATHDSIWSELQDRQKRSQNIMLFNVPENGDDLREISVVLSTLTDNPPTVTQFARVGRKNAKGARALRVSLSSQREALALIRNKTKLKGKNIYLNLDLTPEQRKIESKVWSDFRERKSKGDANVRLRYTNGVPQIVNSSEN